MRKRFVVIFPVISLFCLAFVSCKIFFKDPDLAYAVPSERVFAVAVSSNAPSFSNYYRQRYIRPAEIVLRIYMDGSAYRTLESSPENFFAAGFGIRNEVISLPVMIEKIH